MFRWKNSRNEFFFRSKGDKIDNDCQLFYRLFLDITSVDVAKNYIIMFLPFIFICYNFILKYYSVN